MSSEKKRTTEIAEFLKSIYSAYAKASEFGKLVTAIFELPLSSLFEGPNDYVLKKLGVITTPKESSVSSLFGSTSLSSSHYLSSTTSLKAMTQLKSQL